MNKLTTTDLRFEPSALRVSSDSSRREPDDVDRFVEFVHTGIHNWILAGKLLIALKKKDQNIFRTIVNRCEWVTYDSLYIFERIGNQELRPEVMLLSGNLSAKLMRLSYAQQSRIIDHPVKVVEGVDDKGRPYVISKRATELTARNCDTLIKGSKILTVQEQVDALMERQPSQVEQPARQPLAPTPMFIGQFRVELDNGTPMLVREQSLKTGVIRVRPGTVIEVIQ